MSEAEQLKKQCMIMAVEQIEELLNIIGELGYIRYKIVLCKLKGNSLLQCAIKCRVTKRIAQKAWEKSTRNGYDIALKKIFQLK